MITKDTTIFIDKTKPIRHYKRKCYYCKKNKKCICWKLHYGLWVCESCNKERGE